MEIVYNDNINEEQKNRFEIMRKKFWIIEHDLKPIENDLKLEITYAETKTFQSRQEIGTHKEGEEQLFATLDYDDIEFEVAVWYKRYYITAVICRITDDTPLYNVIRAIHRTMLAEGIIDK